MDDIRDIQKGDEFSRFIDSQVIRTDPFGNNRVAERLYRRAERIVAAIYLLTRHIPIGEPIRLEARQSATALFKTILELKHETRASESIEMLSFQSLIRNLISLCRMLTAGGFVSFQNADTVISALDELGTFLMSSQRNALAEEVSLTRENLLGDTSPLSDRNTVRDVKDRKYIKDISVIKDTTFVQSSSRTTIVAAARVDGILAVLRSGGEIGIKDICSRLPDYSEKMIQRELADPVKNGQVKKVGLKRWSRYSIASQL